MNWLKMKEELQRARDEICVIQVVEDNNFKGERIEKILASLDRITASLNEELSTMSHSDGVE